MAKRTRAYSRTVRNAAQLLGAQIRLARIERRWSAHELADRAGISKDTLRKVEKGDPTVSLGVAFDLATLVGVPLFYEERSRLASETARAQERVALMPQRIRAPAVDDDF
ncbi:MAG: helix-turn-helix domain-containing protein [Solirubrobacteraceae bacterium]